jgi:hypothetical protein
MLMNYFTAELMLIERWISVSKPLADLEHAPDVCRLTEGSAAPPGLLQ